MISVDVIISDEITKDIARVKKELAKLPAEGLVEFKALTPIRSGNARRNTYLKGNTIEANYPYAARLDEGYSRQAPKGMMEPWTKWFEKRIQKIMGR
jgi:hypothetical protein